MYSKTCLAKMANGLCTYKDCEHHLFSKMFCKKHLIKMKLGGKNKSRDAINKQSMIEHCKTFPFVGLDNKSNIVTTWHKEWDNDPAQFFMDVQYLLCYPCKQFVKTYIGKPERSMGMNYLTIDHIDGNNNNNAIGNKVCICNRCNASKKGKPINTLFSKAGQHKIINRVSRYKFPRGETGNKQWMVENGICNRCTREFATHGIHCKRCHLKHIGERNKRIENGLCVWSGCNNEPEPGMRKCRKHLDRDNKSR